MGDQGGGVRRSAERSGELTNPIAQALAAEPFTALLGGAGTGKTFLVKQWMREAELGSLALAATTGIAAVNLGEGTTINALLRYFNTESLIDLFTSGALTMRLKKLRRAGLRRIILDEVSMLDGDQLTVLVRAVEECNGEGFDLGDVAEEDKDLPPLGLTVVGDFCQLPPVKAPFAFESLEWGKFSVQTLSKVWRQQDDAFVDALRAARRGDGRGAVEALEPCFVKATDPHFDGPTLLAKNDAVDRYNRLKLDALQTAEATFSASRWGEQRTEWKQIPETLVLKEGCLVMALANDYDEELDAYRYVNGDLGIFREMDRAGNALVTFQRTGATEDVIRITRVVTEPMEVGERKALKAAGEAHRIKDKNKVVGEITYMPLRVAYATTVHKSQGLSLDRVQVNLREPFMASPGMAYVALSRARTLEGLRLIGSAQTFVARCTVDPRVRQWI